MIRTLILSWMVWLALPAAPVSPLPGEIVPWQGLFITTAGPRWIDRAAQVQAESGFNPTAVSPAGAIGASQWMPRSWTYAQARGWAPKGSSPLDPIAAIPATHRYMLDMEGRARGEEVDDGGGVLDPALAGYNWGESRVMAVRRRAMTTGLPGAGAWKRFLPAETQGYLRRNGENRTRIRARLEALHAHP